MYKHPSLLIFLFLCIYNTKIILSTIYTNNVTNPTEVFTIFECFMRLFVETKIKMYSTVVVNIFNLFCYDMKLSMKNSNKKLIVW